jgi:hypothetical protein
MNVNRVFVLGAIVVVVGGLALAFAFLGTPSHQRLVSLDEKRLEGLQEIASSLHDRYQSRGLPTVLPRTIFANDAATVRDYEYRRIDATHYVLCATFSTNDGNDEAYRGQEEVVWPRHVWRHGRGHQCYNLDVTESMPMPLR